MRSRYTAYVLADSDYLLHSWHPDTRPRTLDIDKDEIQWTGLDVCNSKAGQPGDSHGRVEFIARYELKGQSGEVHEDSRFVYQQGQCLYVDGVMKSTNKVGRNDPCPRGSGKKYKKCCGR